MKPTNTTVTSKSPSRGGREAVMLRNEFYRDKFRLLATCVPILAVALLVSVVLNVVQATRKTERDYFSVDEKGRVTPIVALSEPYVTDSYLLSWVSETVSRAYSFDAQNMQRQIGDLQPEFTPDGYNQYVEALQSSGIIDFVKKNLLIVSATPRGIPVITRTGSVGGAVVWQVQIPMLVQYRSNTKSAEKQLMVQLSVIRRQTIESPRGIGISQFIAVEK